MPPWHSSDVPVRMRGYKLTLLQKPSSRVSAAPQQTAVHVFLCQLGPPACDGGGSSNHECCRREICADREGEYGHICNRSFSWRAPERQTSLWLQHSQRPRCLQAASQLRCKQLIPVGSHPQPFPGLTQSTPAFPAQCVASLTFRRRFVFTEELL